MRVLLYALAAKGEVASSMSRMSRAAITADGAERIEAFLVNGIIAFFAAPEVVAINRAVGATGSRGYWFDTYSVTATGTVRPFSLVVTRDEGRLAVHEVIVNKCRQDRHPFCP